ncbi:uncharacterized protein DS421_20g703570 [Arachis hypogaea]|nr:uncharacterized protein DS421_20g703570 [Arachis hypogaea]
MVQECLMNFGVIPTASECRGSFIKLTWLRNVKYGIILITHEAMEHYTRCHIMSLFGTTLFADKSGAGMHWKFLPLLRDIPRIRTYSWGSACLAHLCRSLCWATQYDYKDLDGPLALLHVWAWERMPFLAPIRRPPTFPLACWWNEWDSPSIEFTRWTPAHFRQMLDNITNANFLWDHVGNAS